MCFGVAIRNNSDKVATTVIKVITKIIIVKII